MCIRRDIFWITGLTLVCLLVLAVNSFSDSENTDTRLRQYRAVRPLGMAEAFAAKEAAGLQRGWEAYAARYTAMAAMAEGLK